jgi:hypothetical protein
MIARPPVWPLEHKQGGDPITEASVLSMSGPQP